MINKILKLNALVLFLSFFATAQPEQGKDYELIPSGLIEGQSVTEGIGWIRVRPILNSL